MYTSTMWWWSFNENEIVHGGRHTTQADQLRGKSVKTTDILQQNWRSKTIKKVPTPKIFSLEP